MKLIILCIIAGSAIGTSSGIGLWPVWQQPKNIRIQLTLAIIGAVLMGIILMQL
jgi:hypothetical protein